MTPLSGDEITDFRENWIRDRYYPSPSSKPGLSPYNRQQRADFFSDDQLQSLAAGVENHWLGVLSGIWDERHSTELDAGTDEATAAARADADQLWALYILMRGEAHTRMAMDAGFMSCYAVGGDSSVVDKVLEQWNRTDETDINQVRSRSGSTAAILLERR